MLNFGRKSSSFLFLFPLYLSPFLFLYLFSIGLYLSRTGAGWTSQEKMVSRRNILGIFFEQVEGGFEKRRNGEKDVLREEKSFAAPQCLIFRHRVFAPPSFFHIVVPAPSLEPLDSLAPLRAASRSGAGSAPPRLLLHSLSLPPHWPDLGAGGRDWPDLGGAGPLAGHCREARPWHSRWRAHSLVSI